MSGNNPVEPGSAVRGDETRRGDLRGGAVRARDGHALDTRAPDATEILSAVYLVGAGLLFTTRWNTSVEFRSAVIENAAFLLFLVLTMGLRRVWAGSAAVHGQEARRSAGREPAARAEVRRAATILQTARDLYPLVLCGIAYVQVGLFARLLYGPGVTFDSVVAAWDSAFFGVSPHIWMHQVLPGRFWAEMMHLLYVLYYPLLLGGFLFVLVYRRWDYRRYAFVFVASFFSFVGVFSVFPVSGPMGYREGLFPDTILLSNLVDYLYSFGIPVEGGAFPSAHVGQSVVVLLLLRPIGKPVQALILFVTLGIAVSMAFASVHYAIDAVAGVPAGILLYYLWNGVYRRYLT